MNYRAITGFFLRISIGALFLYFGVQALTQPLVAMSYIPAYAEFLANNTFITVYGVVEVLIGLALLIGIYVRYAALLAAALLVGVVIALGNNEVMYRDLVILFATLVLAYEPAHLWALKER
ncbi:MAG: DoxX family membrane protein [Candidatus Woesearchaeota archaeon]